MSSPITLRIPKTMSCVNAFHALSKSSELANLKQKETFFHKIRKNHPLSKIERLPLGFRIELEKGIKQKEDFLCEMEREEEFLAKIKKAFPSEIEQEEEEIILLRNELKEAILSGIKKEKVFLAQLKLKKKPSSKIKKEGTILFRFEEETILSRFEKAEAILSMIKKAETILSMIEQEKVKYLPVMIKPEEIEIIFSELKGLALSELRKPISSEVREAISSEVREAISSEIKKNIFLIVVLKKNMLSMNVLKKNMLSSLEKEKAILSYTPKEKKYYQLLETALSNVIQAQSELKSTNSEPEELTTAKKVSVLFTKRDIFFDSVHSKIFKTDFSKFPEIDVHLYDCHFGPGSAQKAIEQYDKIPSNERFDKNNSYKFEELRSHTE